MSEWVIFNTPAVIIMYLAAFFSAVFCRIIKNNKGFFSFVSAALCISGTAVLIVFGGSLWEAAAFLILFLLISAGVDK